MKWRETTQPTALEERVARILKKAIKREIRKETPPKQKLKPLMRLGRELYGTAREVEKHVFKGQRLYSGQVRRIATGLQRKFALRMAWLQVNRAYYHLNDYAEAWQKYRRGGGRKIGKGLKR